MYFEVKEYNGFHSQGVRVFVAKYTAILRQMKIVCLLLSLYILANNTTLYLFQRDYSNDHTADSQPHRRTRCGG